MDDNLVLLCWCGALGLIGLSYWLGVWVQSLDPSLDKMPGVTVFMTLMAIIGVLGSLVALVSGFLESL